MILRFSFNAKLATLLIFGEIAPSPLLAYNNAQQLPLGSWKGVPATNVTAFPTATERLERAAQAGRAAGVFHCVIRDGQVIHQAAAGVANPETGAPFTPDTIVRIYSMTKPITSVGALVLLDQGEFRLDDPVAKFIPAFTNATVLEKSGDTIRRVPPKRPITVRDVFTHTTGYSYGDEMEVREFYQREGLRYRGPHELFPPEMSIAQAAEAMARIPALHHPGERFTYGFNTDLLGRLIEIWSGQPLDVFLREAVFEPLQMSDTAFSVPANKRDRFASCFGTRDGKRAVVDPAATSPFNAGFSFLSGGGGLVSTARDYARFGQMLVDGGVAGGRRLLRAETLGLMFTNQLSGGGDKGFRFGLGLEIKAVTLGSGAEQRAATGYTWGGYASTDFRIIPSERTVQLVLRQEVPFDNSLARELNAAVDAAWLSAKRPRDQGGPPTDAAPKP
jgi:CubicO group peptidase (beta-lactamase class C family)